MQGYYGWHPRLIEAAIALHDNRLDVAERLLKPVMRGEGRYHVETY